MDINTQLGKYKLTEKLGKGGMAEVFKAFQSGVDRYVAVKVMHSHLADSDDFQMRFQREAKAVGKLQHPNIMRVIDFESKGEHSYMVMEFVKGGSLRDHLDSNKGPMEIAYALKIIKQLADALRYAHGQGMVHRDIKPANVMFSDPQHQHAILADFGIAQLLDEVKITMSGTMLGTPAYMAPEIVKGDPADSRADLYSLGAMLYEMVTGRTPHTGDTPYAVMLKQANEEMPPPRELNKEISDGLEAFLAKALQKDPSKRYQSAEQMIVDLQALDQSGDPTFVKMPEKKKAEKEPNRLLPLLGAVAGVAIIGALTFFLLNRAPEADSTVADGVTAESTTAEVVADEPSPTEDTEVAAVEPTAEPQPEEEALVETETETEESVVTVEPTVEPAQDSAESETEVEAPIEVVAFDFDGTPNAFICTISAETLQNFTFSMDRVRQPPAGNQYVVWLFNGEQLVFSEPVAVENGRFEFSEVVGNEDGVLPPYNRLVISEESAENPPSTPSATVLLDATVDGTTASAIQTLINDDLFNGQTELALAIQHRNLMQDNLDAGNQTEALRHAEHVINILNGNDGDLFGDLDGSGSAENPGDGVGLLTYFNRANTNAGLATQSLNLATKSSGERLAASTATLVELIDSVEEMVFKSFATDSAEEMNNITNSALIDLESADAESATTRAVAHQLFLRNLVAENRLVEATETNFGTVSFLGDQLFFNVTGMKAAPVGFSNNVWVFADGALVKLGALNIDGILLSDINLASFTSIESFEVWRQPTDDDASFPSGDLLYDGFLNATIASVVDGFLTGDSPQLAQLLEQSQLAQDHAELLEQALAADDLAEAQRHAEHIVNIFEGESGANFGDLDGNGTIENPGNGMGVLTYLAEMQSALGTLELEIDQQRYSAELLSRTMTNQQSQIEFIVEVARDMNLTDDIGAGKPMGGIIVDEVAGLLDGFDADRNGVLDAFSAESGIQNLETLISHLVILSVERP